MSIDPQTTANTAAITVLQHQTAGQFNQGTPGFITWVPGGGSGFDISLFPFAYTIAGAVITIAAGEVRRGIRAAVTPTGSPLTVLFVGTSYIFVNVVLASMTCTLQQTGSATKPTSDATNYKCWLYQVSLTAGGELTVTSIGHIGNVELPGVTG